MISITNKYLCSGCAACKAVCPKQCITMRMDKEGFLYPFADTEACINCSLCEKVCPILNQSKIVTHTIKAYGAYNLDISDRINSSSGGIFPLLAREILKNDGIVFGAAFDDDFNLKQLSTQEVDLSKLISSKYLQSDTDKSFIKVKEYLQKGRDVIFCSTPCQIKALRNFLGKDYENLLLIDFVCHGVPSNKLFKTYIEYLEKKYNSKVIDIDFRNKKNGWKNYGIKVVFNNGYELFEIFNKNPYMKAFLKNIDLRPSCYQCAFKTTPKYSDITLADFWGKEKVVDLEDDNKGMSLVIVNTSQGERYFKKIKENTFFVEVNLNEALKYNSSAYKSVSEHQKRSEFLELISKRNFKKTVNKYCDTGFALKIMYKIRNIIKGVKR